VSLLADVLELEFQQFQSVQGLEGRAACQDDEESFRLHRRSQFLVWDSRTLSSWHADLLLAGRSGRNLVQEKYARMMEWTDPEVFRSFASLLPVVPRDVRYFVEEMVELNLRCRAELDARYPGLAARSRPPRQGGEGLPGTSFEVYLRGEALTYSRETAASLLQTLRDYESQGENPVALTLLHTVRALGFRDLAEAEQQAVRLERPVPGGAPPG